MRASRRNRGRNGSPRCLGHQSGKRRFTLQQYFPRYSIRHSSLSSSERLLRLLKGRLRFAAEQENIWWGVSVEDRKHGLPRVDHLRQAPAKVRFLSIEPLLEDLGEIDLSGITWVIVGGESGPGARTMKREWVVSIRRQCREQGVPFFFKQWGGVRKAKNGRLLDGHTYDEYPARVLRAVPDRAVCIAWAAEFGRSLQSSALAVG